MPPFCFNRFDSMKSDIKLILSYLIFQFAFANCFAQNNNTVTDCQGNKYPVVRIGNQYWMAENLKCTKYDTESERAGVMLSVSCCTYTPYYIDGRYARTDYSDDLSYTQREKLGLLYNWTAAVGISSVDDALRETSNFNHLRQGVCPNGWHIPTLSEWNRLAIAMGGQKGSVYYYGVGAKLKTVRGWYDGGNGTDVVGFAALPAGELYDGTVTGVGDCTNFWSANPDGESSQSAFVCSIRSDMDLFYVDTAIEKYKVASVRCVKNDSGSTNTAKQGLSKSSGENGSNSNMKPKLTK